MPEPNLLFDPYDTSKRDPHPLKGLLAYGPFSRANLGAVPDTIRIATITPHGQAAALEKLIAELTRPHRPKERLKYLPDYPGFEQVFHRRIRAAAAPGRLELPADLDSLMGCDPHPHRLLADALQAALSRLQLARSEWEVAFIFLPERWRRGFLGGPGE